MEHGPGGQNYATAGVVDDAPGGESGEGAAHQADALRHIEEAENILFGQVEH
jgi:hypothetical protein